MVFDADYEPRRLTRNRRWPNYYGFSNLSASDSSGAIVLLPDADVSDEDNFSSDSECAVEDSTIAAGDGLTGDEDFDDISDVSSSRSIPNTDKYKFKKEELPKPDLQWTDSPSDFGETCNSPLDYFHLFFTPAMIEEIVDQTNFYGTQSIHPINTTVEEIGKLLGVFLRMGVVPAPQYKLYWNEKSRQPLIADVFARRRFDELKRCLHFADNNECVTDRNDPRYDRMFKIRPILNKLREACLTAPATQFHDVDEQIIPFKGRHGLKVYMKNKPHKWGFKVYSRNGSDGLTQDFIIYDGKKPQPSHSCGYVPGDVVILLCETLENKEERKYVVSFDNFFNSLELQESLLKEYSIFSIGTLRRDRLRGCPLKTEKELKKTGRGSFDYRTDEATNLTIVRWLDSSVVQVSSTCFGVEPIDTVRRWDRSKKTFIEVARPYIVAKYNKHMGGTDLFDMLTSLYRISHKSNKWYIRIFFWVLHTAVVNAWLIYRRRHGKKPLIEFVIDLAFELINTNKRISLSVGQKRGRPACTIRLMDANLLITSAPTKRRAPQSHVTLDSSRYDQVGHFPHIRAKQRCKVCGAKVVMYCLKCNCHLCVTKDRNCFLKFHTSDE